MMKALVYRRFGAADVLEWVDDWPYPELSGDTVLVETVAGSVNPKDVLMRTGKFRRTLARDPLPRASGLDVSGRVVAVGERVSGFSVGDAVFGMTNHFSGGVHVEVARFQQGEIQHAPENVSLEAASAVPLAAQTALQALRDCCAVTKGQRVLINGASGGVGHFAVQIARAMGLETHAVCGPSNVDFVKSLGADAVYDYTNTPAVEVRSRFDAVFDVFGKFTGSMFSDQLERGGVYVSTVPKIPTLGGELVARLGVKTSSRLVQVQSNSQDLLQIKTWIEQGLLQPHVQRSFPVEDAAQAHRQIESKRTVGKVCIALGAA
ncbi:NAD(P)-dependent alcohol dehydrogenase [Aquisalimonas lutea]|uniref:NAD(P)-dependent alcohol dehydrogenase n=1 Tax=Aquisalimonas lutea TaxID=1327750 RepID=UPI0025B29CF7|nr:NAD(P)-dependent alcohol dehydrogenase [Aquisalimonas lutea]MDN3517532.1 NAD(P)-dependent alcohol dehydrogenase [Aquisalimonas lutea]